MSGEENLICENEKEMDEINRIREVLSQVLASIPLFSLLMATGMSLIFVSVVIPDLLDAPGELSLTKEQASWFGSLIFLVQPIGGVFSGPICDYFGRKRSLAVVNIPQLIGWTLYHYSWNVPSLFIANILLGVGCGVMEAPSITYVAEISDPGVRGVLTTIAMMFVGFGAFVACVLGTMFHWKTAALIVLAWPIFTCILVPFIPETPVWLQSKGREEEALKALCWLRGWCQKQNVHKEYQDLLDYNEILNQCALCMKLKSTGDCNHKGQPFLKRLRNNLKYNIFVKETMRPMVFVLMYLMAFSFSGFGPTRPNAVNISNALGMTISGEGVLLITGCFITMANISSAALVKLIGKRKVAIIAMLGTSLSSLCLAVYAMINLENVSSYVPATFPKEKSVLPTVFFFLLYAFAGFSLPWVLVCEVFPFKSRGTATGIAAASAYIMIFISTKIQLDIETRFDITGAFFVNAGFAFLGVIYLYLFMPETEKKTLAEIEEHFSGDDILVDTVVRRCLKGKKKPRQNEEELQKVMVGKSTDC